MAQATWLEIRQALAGTLRLARGDRGGLACFDASLDGFWRSFRAAILIYPLYLVLLGLHLDLPAGKWAIAQLAIILVVETIAYVVSWVAFPLVVLPFTRWLGREHRFFAFMVAYNWAQLPQIAIFVAIGLLPATPQRIAELVATIAALVYEWYIARVALETGGAASTAIVLIDLVLGVLVSRVSDSLY